ncbi:Bug family tripartite tricarboxylate transporter substrate binding protein [Acidovorax sp. NCPPB 4044]|uniref:Bug family tripartite tricarboxylate transporter substrate binding protein n=1 Tax=Acidovorax sp. NCPPB 4044 TaxID=2940490 RepID=UPI00230350F4|nr:tripartite tricarboxylate transporter substrate binding protein [Acidovorax sp. NCPPB 4044]MDA8520163.1 tripartite tricarboxylate transporter substrate binding protein [Acidovorax sp. NCPPB 4044]
MTTSAFKLAALVAAAFSLTQPALAAWPDDKPIEVVVGFAAGGGTDLMARKLLPFVQKRLGPTAQFVVVNKPGAAGEIANAYAKAAKPDGYTLAVINVPGFLFLPMTKKSQYQAEDFTLISRVVDDPTVLVTKSDSPVQTLPGLVAALKSKPGSLTFGHNGVTTNGDLALQLVSREAKVELNAIPYKGTAAQKTDVLGGHLAFGVVSAGEVPELHGNGSGQLKVVAQFGEKRSPALPNVPTASEGGVHVVMSSERGFAAPKGVPANIIKKLDQAIAEAVRDPEFIANASADAPVLAYLSGTQWDKSLEKNRAALQELAKTLPKQ